MLEEVSSVRFADLADNAYDVCENLIKHCISYHSRVEVLRRSAFQLDDLMFSIRSTCEHLRDHKLKSDSWNDRISACLSDKDCSVLSRIGDFKMFSTAAYNLLKSRVRELPSFEILDQSRSLLDKTIIAFEGTSNQFENDAADIEITKKFTEMLRAKHEVEKYLDAQQRIGQSGSSSRSAKNMRNSSSSGSNHGGGDLKGDHQSDSDFDGSNSGKNKKAAAGAVKGKNSLVNVKMSGSGGGGSRGRPPVKKTVSCSSSSSSAAAAMSSGGSIKKKSQAYESDSEKEEVERGISSSRQAMNRSKRRYSGRDEIEDEDDDDSEEESDVDLALAVARSIKEQLNKKNKESESEEEMKSNQTQTRLKASKREANASSSGRGNAKQPIKTAAAASPHIHVIDLTVDIPHASTGSSFNHTSSSTSPSRPPTVVSLPSQQTLFLDKDRAAHDETLTEETGVAAAAATLATCGTSDDDKATVTPTMTKKFSNIDSIAVPLAVPSPPAAASSTQVSDLISRLQDTLRDSVNAHARQDSESTTSLPVTECVSASSSSGAKATTSTESQNWSATLKRVRDLVEGPGATKRVRIEVTEKTSASHSSSEKGRQL